ncbi:hypothetical protein [Dactylosporangium sp. CA-233914]|uniref:hypothetical protein n=1 Tax=Dactylosporangium sp. CA-233914 TaxID=3239934 RepID=UPI003D93E833
MTGAAHILVTYADDDGAAAHTARLIADTLVLHGLHSTVRPVDRAGAIGGYDAVVLGSTARAGHWLRRAVRFALANQAGLRRVPVWLYSNSSPGDALVPEQRIALDPVEEAVEPRDHHPFLSGGARIAWAPHALEPEPGEVCGWAHQIAAALRPEGT